MKRSPTGNRSSKESYSGEPDDYAWGSRQGSYVLSDLEREETMLKMTPCDPKLGLLTMLLVAAALPADAESMWTVGLGLTLETSPINDDDADLSPIPIITYENDDVLGGSLTIGTTEGLSYGWSLPHGMTVSGLVDYRTSPLDDADGSVADGIERDPAIELGGEIDYLTSRGIFSASILADVSGAHDGAEVTLAYHLLVPLGAWTFQPSLGIHYRSKGLGTYLYGVEADDSQTPFRVDDHVVPFANLTADVALNERWSAIVGISGEYLPDAVTDSPLVDDHYTFGTVLGLSFTF